MGCSNSEKWASRTWGQEGGSGGSTPLIGYYFGGAVNAATDFLLIHNHGTGGTVRAARGNLTDWDVAYPGRIVRISWQSFTGDNTSQFNLYNGAGVGELVTLTGATGWMDITGFDVAQGVKLASEFAAGTVSGFTTMQLWQQVTAI